MSLVASLNVGVSALRSFSSGIQVISNNIANVSTVAYKSSHANYSDTFSNLLRPLVPNEKGDVGAKIDPTQIGGGVQVQSVTASFTQGTVNNTGSTSDLAIAGPGYFRVKDPVSGNSYVTRAGNFRFDANGYLVTQQGHRVQGTNSATTKVAYDPATGGYDVKTASSNPLTKSAYAFSTTSPFELTGVDPTGLSVGMVVYSNYSVPPFVGTTAGTIAAPSFEVTGITGLKDASGNAITPSVAFKVGQSITGEGIPAGSTISAIDPATNVVTFTNAAGVGGIPLGSVYTSKSTDLFSVTNSSSVAGQPNNHAEIVKISGTTVTLSNMDGLTASTRPQTFVFMNPKTVTLAASGLTAIMKPLAAAINFTVQPVIGQFTATVDPADLYSATNLNGLQVGMMIQSADINNGAPTRIADINTTTGVVTFANAATGTGNPAAIGGTGIARLSNRVYAVTVQNTSGVVDGMVAEFSDPQNPATKMHAVLTVDRSSTTRLLLDFGAFGNGYTGTNVNDATLTANNADPIISNFTSAFNINFQTNSNKTLYTSASLIGDVRIAFDAGKDYTLVDLNGGTLPNYTVALASSGAPAVKSFTVGNDGSIMATLSNGQSFKTGQVLLQDFLDPGALIREGDNLFSGMALAGERGGNKWENLSIADLTSVTAGKAGLGVIQGSALELSNVDIGEEFAKMITTQRSFQAGSRVITVSDQMLEEVVNLKR
jgi:flagellar hook protein FlgE